MSDSLEFSEKELQQIKSHGLEVDQVKGQIDTFKNGIQTVKVEKAATPDDGILQLDHVDGSVAHDIYIIEDKKEITKFIPASGAASRMFKALHQLKAEVDINKNSMDELLQKDEFTSLKPFFDQFEKFAFAEEAKRSAEKKHANFQQLSKDDQQKALLASVLDEDQLGLAELPKGLIPFHQYEDQKLTPFEEHFYESADYAEYQDKAHLHFTVTEDHLIKFQEIEKQSKPDIEEKTGLKYHVDYSFQEKSTDTIAVNPDNSLFQLDNGELLFRPAGHGALIKNLNQIDSDLIFIKNIDNVQRKELAKDNAYYKQVLAGKLIQIQAEVFQWLREIDAGNYEKYQADIDEFIHDSLQVKGAIQDEKLAFQMLNRPIRVCGMVKNEGAPGGGPFWVKLDNGLTTLQIVETSQMDLNDSQQKQILENSTHFNPVDIVCGVKDYQGKKFDLEKYVNPKRGIITKKSAEGKSLKALELPGLWNGAMEYWNTIFVEVPLQTFSPVKTVIDLLNDAHQA